MSWLLLKLVDESKRGEYFRLAEKPTATGVAQVTDISAISRATLDQWLLPPDQTWEYRKKRDGKTAVRNYHKRAHG